MKKSKNAPGGKPLKNADQALDIKAVHQILNGEIDFYEVKGRGLSRRGKDYEEGWLAALKEFRTVLIRAQYTMKDTPPKPVGYMGDIGGTPYGPSDR